MVRIEQRSNVLIREGSEANYNITVKTGKSGEERRGEERRR